METGCSSPDTCSSESCPVQSTCQPEWDKQACACKPGFVGERCDDLCGLDPCLNNGTCAKDTVDPRGYTCDCVSPLVSGRYCQDKVKQPCPANWWGYPVCGPCKCDVANGYNPDCDKLTGECRCKDYHYRPKDSDKCIPCNCFALGSTSQLCDPVSGQCKCKPGVIGQLCDSCAHAKAEVTEEGCDVVYGSCPRSFTAGVWWPRTDYNEVVQVDCPPGSEGTATRQCTEDGFAEPDLFNCTHREMLPLFKDLAQIQTGEIQLNSYLSLKTVSSMYKLGKSIDSMYGADIVLFSKLLLQILEFENNQSGFNLSHKQERDFIKEVVFIGSRILEHENRLVLKDAYNLNRSMFTKILNQFSLYGKTLALNMADTYTNPFEITADNMVFGLDVVEVTKEGNPQSRVLPEPNLIASLARPVQTEYIQFPKYNHYMRNPAAWDNTKIHIPAELLQADPYSGLEKPAIAYTIQKTMPAFLPDNYLPDLVVRWGSYFKAISPLISLSLLSKSDLNEKHELTTPIHVIFTVRLDSSHPRSAPFCARWDSSIPDAQGWTRDGCETGLPDLWQFSKVLEISVNCTCYSLSSYAVLSETVAQGLVISKPLETDNYVIYSVIVSLALLLISFIAFSALYGLPTNTNSIHRFIVVSLFIAQLLFIIETKYHHLIINVGFACNAMAILLHYFWLSVFSWLLVDALHLHRMLTEMRDINHGHMKFYVGTGFGIPAIIVGLSVGVRGHQYGNLHFCWLSLYDVSVWSLVGPLCVALFLQICILFLAIQAAFTLKSQIEDFGNLRGMLLLNIGLLPLVTGTWAASFFLVNEDWPHLSIAYSVATIVTSAYILLGYVVFNARIRTGLRNRYLVCIGRKVPFGKSMNISQGTISRSALAYRNSVKNTNRNIGISTASTTSRSTNKTNSAPYRSDYYSSSDVSKIYGNSTKSMNAKHGQDYRGGGSDTESDGDRRSLDLASSHTSDEDEPLEPVASSGDTTTTRGGYSTDYNTTVPPLHINNSSAHNSSGSAGLVVNDQPISAQNTLQRQSYLSRHYHQQQVQQPPHRSSAERISTLTTSDNNDIIGDYPMHGGEYPMHGGEYPVYGGSGGGYRYNSSGHHISHTGGGGGSGTIPHPLSPATPSELSSEDKYVAMSPPNLLSRYPMAQGYSTSTNSQNFSDPSSSLVTSDMTQDSQNLSSYQS